MKTKIGDQMSKTTVNIHGKEYETVASRIQRFYKDHENWAIITEVFTDNNQPDLVMVKTSIQDENGRVRSTGHAEETRGSTQINRTSALENCETSSVGRALALLGYAGTELASADELTIALKQQANPVQKIKQENNIATGKPVSESVFKDLCFLGKTLNLEKDQAKSLWDNLKAVGITRGRYDAETKSWTGTRILESQAPIIIKTFADFAGYTEEEKEALVLKICGDTPKQLEEYSDAPF